MGTKSIGKRKPVEDIRSIWPKEKDFSDWLITEDGIELISEDLGVAIANPQREARGSNFPCDVVANLLGDEKHAVVIENQFGSTNHDHLGKLLTYAATHKAMTAIWIAEEVADDHRQVVDWLNANTPMTISFFVAELKAYTIGASEPAPQLDVICRPNYIVKPPDGGLTDAEKKRRDWRVAFWTAIHEHIKSKHPPFRLQRPGTDHWSSIAVGRSGFSINMLLTPKNQSVALEVLIQPQGWKDEAFQQLLAQKEEIEAELKSPTPLEWREMPDKISSRILFEAKIDPSVDGNKHKICEWFATWTPVLFNAFSPRIKQLEQA